VMKADVSFHDGLVTIEMSAIEAAELIGELASSHGRQSQELERALEEAQQSIDDAFRLGGPNG